MQVRLIPPSESGLDEIVIDDPVFSVGRNHQPFESYPAQIVGQLSRRHARIFKENGQLFLVDTGSRNGTSLNGKKLKDKPVSLSNGDVISFSSRLTYSVIVEEQPTPDSTVLASEAEIRLSLIPNESAIEPIVVTRFPFLVSKTDRVFADCPAEYAQDIRYISRKHAYFYAKDSEVYIEDLGSTNGTYVNEVRLSEQPVPIKTGDLIGFGGKRLCYAVNIAIEHPVKEPMTEIQKNDVETKLEEIVDQQKTTFVANPNSFLEIFCAPREESGSPTEDEVNPEIEPPQKSPRPAKTAIGRFLRKSRIFLQQARAALSDETTDKRRIRIITAVTVLIVAGGLALYWTGQSKRGIQEFMNQSDYERALELANDYLEEHPDDKEISKIATEAMLKYRVPQWTGFIEKKDYRNAREVIREATEEDTAHNEENVKLIGVLEWVGNLEQFIDYRGGIEAPLTIFKHEQPASDLIQWWDSDQEGHSKSLHLIANSVPEFKAVHARTFKDLRILKNEQSLYLKAVEQLKTTIANKLDSSQARELAAVFDKFEQKYPRIEGMDLVRHDLDLYLEFEELIERKDLRGVIAFLSENPVTIPPFKQKIEDLTGQKLPSAEFRESYLQSSEAWRSGNIDEAIEILAKLAQSAGSEFATPELERKKHIRDRFKVLGATLGTENYGAELLEFHSLLDQQEDIYFLDAIDSEVKAQTDQISKQALKEMDSATTTWKSYVANGRITGIQRLEPGISALFRTQANRLSKAYRHAERAMRFFIAAQVNYSSEQKALYDEVSREARLQLQSLVERENVLDPETLKAKLKLLPEPSEPPADKSVAP